MVRPNVLIADDREDIHGALHLLFKGKGWASQSVFRPQDVLSLVQTSHFDLILLDLNFTRDTTSGREGLDVLASLKKLEPSLPVVVMTAFASVDLAVKTLNHGARDFIEKPWDNLRLISVIENQLALAKALNQAENLAQIQMEDTELVGSSPSMQNVIHLVSQIAPSDVNVLVTGEHGTGKGVIAKLIHQRSNRFHKPMVTVNIGAVAESLFESELFGHVKGAFTDARDSRKGRIEIAEEGTLFLDEIGNLSLTSQAKLLRVIETGEYEVVGSSKTQRSDVRLVSATNLPLFEAVSEGKFREDLLFRLNTIEIKLPALRERGEDILELSNHFLRRYCLRFSRPTLSLSSQAEKSLRTHPWPGNVRELDHVMQRAVLVCTGKNISTEDLGLESKKNRNFTDLNLDRMEGEFIGQALVRTGNNIKEAANLLGISRGSLYRRMEKHGIKVGE